MVDDWEIEPDDLLTVNLICRSGMGRLDRCIGREQFSGVWRCGNLNVDEVLKTMAAGESLGLSIERPSGEGQTPKPQYPVVGGVQDPRPGSAIRSSRSSTARS